MIRPIRFILCVSAAALATGCWFLSGNVAPELTASVTAYLGPWSPALLIAPVALLWVLDKVFGPVFEHHAKKLFISKDDPEAYLPRILAKLDKTETELSKITEIAHDAIAERDRYLLEVYALRRQLGNHARAGHRTQEGLHV